MNNAILRNRECFLIEMELSGFAKNKNAESQTFIAITIFAVNPHFCFVFYKNNLRFFQNFFCKAV